jgi:hypothetical protein
LVVLRRKLAAGIDQCTTLAAVAALIPQFRDVDKEIRQIDAAAAGSSSSGRRCTGDAQRRAATNRSSESMVSMSRMRGGYGRAVLLTLHPRRLAGGPNTRSANWDYQ